MKAYGFMINGRGAGNGYDRKTSYGDQIGKCNHNAPAVKNALRSHKKAARRAGKTACIEGLKNKGE